MLAQRNPEATIKGIEIDELSADEAAENFKSSQWSDNLQCICGSIQDYSWESDEKYDLIVSNPPFFSGGTLSLNENKNNVKHTTRLSHGDLLIAVSRLICNGGNFDLILPYIEGERFIELSHRYNLFPERITEVRSRKDMPIERLMISFSDKKIEVERNTLILFEDGSDRTPTVEYKKLVSSFYLKF
jgi:tRNA1Val (adenine37-N6)-methyltransferase